MPEKTKRNKEGEIAAKKGTVVEQPEKIDEDNWSRDQQENSYYYDDSYGYEIYNPADDKDEKD